MKLRKEVQEFAEAMESTLLDNDHKGGWDDCDLIWLFERVEQEVEELRTALFVAGAEESNILKDKYIEDIKKECTDVANFCMMVYDNIRR